MEESKKKLLENLKEVEHVADLLGLYSEAKKGIKMEEFEKQLNPKLVDAINLLEDFFSGMD